MIKTQAIKERLQKFIASTGYLSRRHAEEAILEGRVFVNGIQVNQLGTRIDPLSDHVSVDGQSLKRPVRCRTLLFNKPRRVITTKSDPEGRKTVMEFLPDELQTLKPVGRLDFDSEGLLVLTEDGELANRIAHPSFGVKKIYRVHVRDVPSSQTLKNLTTSVTLEDGPGRFDAIKRIFDQPLQNKAELEIIVSEGRNRFIRRMLERVGHPVTRLMRIQLGGLKLGGLKSGEYKELQKEDLDLIFATCKSCGHSQNKLSS